VSDRAPTDRRRAAREPERLSREAKLGALIQRANADYRSGLDEADAFQRLAQRLEAPPRRVPTWPRVALGVALSLVVVAVIEMPREQPRTIAVGPDITSGRRSEKEPGEVGAAAPNAETDVGARIEDESGAGNARVDDSERDVALGDRNGRVLAPEASSVSAMGVPAALKHDTRDRDRVPEGAAPSDVEQVVPEREPRFDPTGASRGPRDAQPSEGRANPRVVGSVGGIDDSAVRARGNGPGGVAPSSVARAVDKRFDCLHIARQGELRAAEQCFAERAAGSGLSAEMALYEMARLRRDRDGSGALDALDEYRRRFPQGSLRNEVSITRVELLADLGRSREALDESLALLGSASGQERAAELHMLRGNVFRRDLADPASAAREYAKAEQFGGALAAEATRLQGLSLEATGDARGALEAYRRYLARGDGSRQAEVTRRIEALTAAARTSAGDVGTGAAGASSPGGATEREPTP
jgi:hypothetical protein